MYKIFRNTNGEYWREISSTENLDYKDNEIINDGSKSFVEYYVKAIINGVDKGNSNIVSETFIGNNWYESLVIAEENNHPLLIWNKFFDPEIDIPYSNYITQVAI